MSLSLRSRIWRWILRKTFKSQPRSVAEMRAINEKNARWMQRLPADVSFETTLIKGLPAGWMRSAQANNSQVILYLHGGGYAVGSIAGYKMLCGQMAHALQTDLLIPAYRLAPEYPFPAALEDAQSVYHWLLERGYRAKNIVIAGDSAGGGLSLATVLALRESGTPLPAAVVCLSPWADLALQGETHTTKAEAEAMLTTEGLREWASFYAGSEALNHPFISPVQADFHGFPPLLIQVGSEEILLDDARRLADKARAAGVEVSLQVWDGLWHVWHALGDLIPETGQALAEIDQFIRPRVGRL